MGRGRRTGKAPARSAVSGRPQYKVTGDSLPRDVLNEILLRLSSGICIGRCRCVCKLWNRILSSPLTIHSILSSHNNTEDDDKAQILIKAKQYVDSDEFPPKNRHVYSLLSYNTLRPISPSAQLPDLPSVPNKVRSIFRPHESGEKMPLDLSIVGCCDGIVCIADKLYGNACDFILWNPATSETRILPRSPFTNSHGHSRLFGEPVGFGFDPLTKDYKIVRSISSMSDFHTYGEGDFEGFDVDELYSLRNNSWKKFNGCTANICRPVRYPHTYRGEKLYWWDSDPEKLYLISFDMEKEAYDWADFENPTGKCEWLGDSFTLLKECIVGVFADYRGKYWNDRSFEIWGLLKFDEKMPWTKLFSIPEFGDVCNFPAMWRPGWYFIETREGRELHVFDPEDGKGLMSIVQIKDMGELEMMTYVPSQISLTGLMMN